MAVSYLLCIFSVLMCKKAFISELVSIGNQRRVCVIFSHSACVLLTAHAMRLCEDPGSRQSGLGTVLSLQPTREMAEKEDACQTEGNK